MYQVEFDAVKNLQVYGKQIILMLDRWPDGPARAAVDDQLQYVVCRHGSSGGDHDLRRVRLRKAYLALSVLVTLPKVQTPRQCL